MTDLFGAPDPKPRGKHYCAPLTHARLTELLTYDPESGLFTWRVKRRGRRSVSGVTGSESWKGYLLMTIDGRAYRLHRLAWLYMTEHWPLHEIDHVDCNRQNNKWTNLRDVPREVNQQNQRRPKRSNSASGLLGVCRERNSWRATIQAYGVRYSLGTYKTKELAHSAYVAAKRIMHKGCTL